MPDLTSQPEGRKLLLAAGVMVVVGALLVAFSWLWPSSSEQAAANVAPPASGDRLLQSVDVAIGSDGSLSQVGDTVVISRANTGAADTYDTSYDPSKIVDDLPVRVLPSYQTAQSSGTNLADLKGYTGQVTIDLTVQNLTVKPQKVSYDVAGASKTTTAMVGAPLTVVASASLAGVDPASIVTAQTDTSDSDDVTNGVVSQSSQHVPQVQWATILAPPQLAATATLRLVIDAKNFAVPTVDLSVQPGLVTDPSVGALVDAAFNPKNSDELTLESRTIDVIGDVNDVLTRASSQISKVRRTLDSTSKTLGAKTVVELQQNTREIDTSLKQSDQNLDSLNKDLNSSLKSTSSSTLEKLAATVSQVDALLGDTSLAAPKATVSGSGCESKVSTPTSGGSVYASLLQVTAQLNAYASTTQDCKAELQQAIKTTIGPENPDDTACSGADATSVTCSLQAAADSFDGVEKDIKTGQDVSAGLDPAKDFGDSQATAASLIGQLTAIVKSTDALLDDDPDAPAPALDRIATQLSAAAKALAGAKQSLTDVKGSIGNIHTSAVENQKSAESMVAQNSALAAGLCTVAGDGTQPGKLSAAQVETFRSYLVTKACDGSTDLTPPKGVVAMSTQLGDQADAWQKLADETDTSKTDQGLGQSLSQATTGLDDTSAAIDDASKDVVAGASSVRDVHDAAEQALKDLQSLGGDLGGLQKTYGTAQTELDKALDDAAKKASTTNLKDAIKQVSDQGQASSDQLGKAFENSAAGLTSAAKALQDSGASAIKQQRAELDKTQDQAAKSLSAAMTGSLSQISGNVSSATRDLTTTRTQLTRDLGNVLLDLGDPNVPGSGVIGTVAKGADAAGSADYQLGLATDQTSAYAAVRSQDVAGIMLRQAQAEAALARQADLPAFATQLPDNVQHRTVYTFHLDGGQ